MPEWIICDLDGNELSVDLTKTSINSIDDVKEQFEKFDKQARPSKKNTNKKPQTKNVGGRPSKKQKLKNIKMPEKIDFKSIFGDTSSQS